MTKTQGINHLGLSVKNLEETTRFFVELLGWEESGRDLSYPRTAVTDGTIRLTLWQVDRDNPVVEFDRKRNIGLHHLALTVASEEDLSKLDKAVREWPGVEIEFAPELVGDGPRKHMIFYEPGGIRIEFIWQGI